jgi:hypothetical protein
MRAPNAIIDCGDYYEMVIYNLKHNPIIKTKVDKRYINSILQYRWHFNGRYVQTFNPKIALHQFIIGKKEGYEIDHRNGDKLDNRKENLRHVTHTQNMRNRQKLSTRNTSGCTGVSRFSRDARWRAEIKVEGKTKHLGLFESLNDAIKARKVAEKRYYGKFAPTI